MGQSRGYKNCIHQEQKIATVFGKWFPSVFYLITFFTNLYYAILCMCVYIHVEIHVVWHVIWCTVMGIDPIFRKFSIDVTKLPNLAIDRSRLHGGKINANFGKFSFRSYQKLFAAIRFYRIKTWTDWLTSASSNSTPIHSDSSWWILVLCLLL